MNANTVYNYEEALDDATQAATRLALRVDFHARRLALHENSFNTMLPPEQRAILDYAIEGEKQALTSAENAHNRACNHLLGCTAAWFLWG